MQVPRIVGEAASARAEGAALLARAAAAGCAKEVFSYCFRTNVPLPRVPQAVEPELSFSENVPPLADVKWRDIVEFKFAGPDALWRITASALDCLAYT